MPPLWTDAFVDAEAALQQWINSLTSTLVGPGNPLPLGAHLRRLRSPLKAYVMVSRIGGYDDPGEMPVDNARMTGMVYAGTKEAAGKAAFAYANALRGLQGKPVTTDAGTILSVVSITGPLYSVDGDEERYLVDAVIALRP